MCAVIFYWGRDSELVGDGALLVFRKYMWQEGKNMWHVLSVYAQIRLRNARPFLRKFILKVQIEIVTD